MLLNLFPNRWNQVKIDTQYINFVDNKLVLQIGIEILHDDGLYSTRTLYYEL